ncbi:hypothetical protein HK097_009630 [Rhizophlyctis rosea]|uniref:SH3 domain-containing protein n=1 Tax=Rhizophlyctis rosea TaxID=64517 RepID=A0AAD5SGT1_9FUNG|nr:hypothetical protein HK097_009630 [Rhizophlyctis rosea]
MAKPGSPKPAAQHFTIAQKKRQNRLKRFLIFPTYRKKAHPPINSAPQPQPPNPASSQTNIPPPDSSPSTSNPTTAPEPNPNPSHPHSTPSQPPYAAPSSPTQNDPHSIPLLVPSIHHVNASTDQMALAEVQSGASPQQAPKTAMDDPEVQKVLGDPTMQLILQQMPEDLMIAGASGAAQAAEKDVNVQDTVDVMEVDTAQEPRDEIFHSTSTRTAPPLDLIFGNEAQPQTAQYRAHSALYQLQMNYTASNQQPSSLPPSPPLRNTPLVSVSIPSGGNGSMGMRSHVGTAGNGIPNGGIAGTMFDVADASKIVTDKPPQQPAQYSTQQQQSQLITRNVFLDHDMLKEEAEDVGVDVRSFQVEQAHGSGEEVARVAGEDGDVVMSDANQGGDSVVADSSGSGSSSESMLAKLPPEVLAANLSKNEMMRLCVVYELIETEADYVRDLQTMINYHRKEIKKTNLLSEKEIESIFSNVDQLVPVNQDLLNRLTSKRNMDPLIPEVGDALVDVSDLDEQYGGSRFEFGVFYGGGRQSIHGLERTILTDGLYLSTDQTGAADLQVRYPLLVRELQKQTDPLSQETISLNLAMEKIEAVVASVLVIYPLLSSDQEKAVSDAVSAPYSSEVKKGQFASLTGKDFGTLRPGSNAAKCMDPYYSLLSPFLTSGDLGFQEHRIQYLDSMHLKNERCLANIEEYLRLTHQDRKISTPWVGGWERVYREDVPEQQNGSDCGVFMCLYLEHITRGVVNFDKKQLEKEMPFRQGHMPFLRRRLVSDILQSRITVGDRKPLLAPTRLDSLASSQTTKPSTNTIPTTVTYPSFIHPPDAGKQPYHNAVWFHFPHQHDELEVQPGDVVEEMKVYADGWMMVLDKEKRVGMVPANILKEVSHA